MNKRSLKLFEKIYELKLIKIVQQDFLGGTVDKDLPANTGDMGSVAGLGRSHMLQSN